MILNQLKPHQNPNNNKSQTPSHPEQLEMSSETQLDIFTSKTIELIKATLI